MVYLSKIYTKTGDKGTTRLVGGQEVAKDAARIEAYGTVDELMSVLGLARVFLQAEREAEPAVRERLSGLLRRLQNELFNLGSELATLPRDQWPGQPLVQEQNITRLEHEIDELNAELEPLRSFVLPGGGPVAAFLHQARTVCRRAERRVVTLAQLEEVSGRAVVYLNRLSDLLFVLSRWATRHLGQEELLWEPQSVMQPRPSPLAAAEGQAQGPDA
jgi:cob(I)alamin adenosyltransferase